MVKFDANSNHRKSNICMMIKAEGVKRDYRYCGYCTYLICVSIILLVLSQKMIAFGLFSAYSKSVSWKDYYVSENY